MDETLQTSLNNNAIIHDYLNEINKWSTHVDAIFITFSDAGSIPAASTQPSNSV